MTMWITRLGGYIPAVRDITGRSRAFPGWGRSGWLLVVIAVLFFGIHGCPRPGIPSRNGAKQVIAAAGVEPGDVSALDFVVQGDRLHLVWLYAAGDHRGYIKSKTVWYSRCDLKTNSWMKPIVLATDADGPPRIAALSDTLHVLVPHDLRHFVSGDSGSTWSKSTPLLVPNGFLATEAELVPDGDSLVAVYMSRTRRDEFELGPNTLFVTTWAHETLGSVQSLYESSVFPIPFGMTPRLAISGGVRHVYLAITHRLPSYSTGTLCHWMASPADGYRWSRPDSSEWPSEIYRPANESSVYEYGATAVGQQSAAFAEIGRAHV